MAAAKKQVQKPMYDRHSHGKKKMLPGLGIFLLGLIKYLGYEWEIALMVVGALAFLKGLLMK